MTRNAFYAALCEELIAFKDTTGEEDAAALIGLPVCKTLGGHRPIPVNHKDRMRCAVCKLEEPWMDAKKLNVSMVKDQDNKGIWQYSQSVG